MTLGKYISTLRKNNKMTQSALGKLMGISVSEIKLWESDRSSPNALQIKRLANIFKVEESLFLVPEKVDNKEQEIQKYLKNKQKKEYINLTILMFTIIHSVLFAVFITYEHMVANQYPIYYLIAFNLISLMCLIVASMTSFYASLNAKRLREVYKKASKQIWIERAVFFYNALLLSAVVAISLSNIFIVYGIMAKEQIFTISFSGMFPLVLSFVCSLYFFIRKLRVDSGIIKIATFFIAIITILPFGVIYGFNLADNGYFINQNVTVISLSVIIWLCASNTLLFAMISPKTFNMKNIIGFVPWLLMLFWGIFVAREWISNVFFLIQYAMAIKIGLAVLRMVALSAAMVIVVLSIIKAVRQRKIKLYDIVCYISLVSFAAAEISYIYYYFANKSNPSFHYWAFPYISGNIGVWLSGFLIAAAIIFLIKKRYKSPHKGT